MLLKADRIELAILKALIDWHEPSGRCLDPHQLQQEINPAVGEEVYQPEVIDALVLMYERQLVELVDKEYHPYETKSHVRFFYGPPFRVKALPRARRRQQELTGDNRAGIFISHFGPEKPVALRLQKLFQDCLSPGVPIFVSSDYQSIESGDEWYAAILSGLAKSQVVVALLSPDSIGRRWINFEAGFGLGQKSRVIPLVWRRLSKDDIGMPLGQLHARDLHDLNDLRALLDTIATLCRLSLSPDPISQFLGDLPSLEAQIPTTSLEVTVFRRERAIHVCIRNSGNRLLDMLDAELLVPEQLQGTNFVSSQPPVRTEKRFEGDGVRWIGHCLTTKASPQPHLGIVPLPETLVPQMGEIQVTGLTISLPANLSPADESLPIRYRVSARQESVGPITIPISQLERR